jgi:hypothetical protein
MEKTSNMDDPRDKDNGLQKKDEDSFVNFSDFFQPTWFRRFIRSSDEVDRFILDNPIFTKPHFKTKRSGF